jgi:hypothetical protein
MAPKGNNSKQQPSENELVQAEGIKLSTPIAKYNSTLFADSITLSFLPGYPGSSIRYTKDGTEPNEQSPVFEGRKSLKSSILIKAAAFHPELMTSDIVEVDFVQVPKLKDVKNIALLTEPGDSYKGQGAKSLIDLNKGTLNFREPVWMGFSGEDVEIKIDFEKPKKVNKVVLSTMADHGAWIFLPKQIEVKSQSGIFKGDFGVPESAATPKLEYLVVKLDQTETTSLHIVIKNLDTLPEWHPGVGGKPWLFIDEIVIK